MDKNGKRIVKLSKKTNRFILTDYDKNLQIDYAHYIPMVKAPYHQLLIVDILTINTWKLSY
ncbi:hypothetical protein [uncultured Bacteroides sp.]|uniref:hypothetical protein n=1 Tax=uncultured Bacteroides sp. TaxID=162156 RepID=UPI0025D9BDEF|nr:hypothetical protein [uncultured Bacteroides sp.]